MEGIVLTHLSGSKATKEDVFPLNLFEDIVIGRDHWSHVEFSESETMVSRQHAKITQHPKDPTQFFITDLNSRNGTYVNNQRIFGKARLKPGDVIQCGFGGPEFRFSIEPETDRLNAANMPVPTANLLKYSSLELAEQGSPPAEAPAAPVAPLSDAPLDPIDEQSVEESSEPAKGKLGKSIDVGVWVFMGLIALGSGFVIYRNFKLDGSSPVVDPVSASQQGSLPDGGGGTPLPSPTTTGAQSPAIDAPSTVSGPAAPALNSAETATKAAPSAALKTPTTTAKGNLTTVNRARRSNVLVRRNIDPKEAAKRLKKEQKRREKEAKKNKSRYKSP